MEVNRIARILYNTSLGPDCLYSLDNEASEIEIIAISEEIKGIKEKDSPLFNILENLAYENEKMEFWKEETA